MDRERPKPAAAEFETAACEAAQSAGAILKRRFRKALAFELKGVHDFVSEVDREAEAAVIAHLRSRFPDHAFMAEESFPETLPSDHRWIIDPLDGTTNFLHGIPVFAVSVALEDAAGLIAGAIHDPLQDETFHAYRGGGARLNGQPIHCSDQGDTHHALIATGFPYRELSRIRQYMTAFEAFVRVTSGLRRAGSASLDLAYTACGRYDGFWEIGLSRWDIAAGALIVQEAGGLVTDVAGESGFLDSGDLVAAGKPLHPQLLRVTRSAFA